MITIRYGMFETNSSSVHTLVIANDEEYKKLLDKELIIVDEELMDIDTWRNDFLSICHAHNKDDTEIDNKSIDELIEEYNAGFGDVAYFEDYMEEEECETYERDYVSPSGDKLHIFGHYGGYY